MKPIVPCHQTLRIYDGPMLHHLLDSQTVSVGTMNNDDDYDDDDDHDK